jgi:hypothetical protein
VVPPATRGARGLSTAILVRRRALLRKVSDPARLLVRLQALPGPTDFLHLQDTLSAMLRIRPVPALPC